MIIVEIAGNLGDDAEERHTPTGKKVIRLRLAARTRKGETVWWQVNIWEETCQKIQPMLPYLKKGTGLIIIGEMNKPETYVGKDGSTQITLTVNADIVKFSPFGKGGGEKNQQQQQQQQQPAYKPAEVPVAQESYAGYGASLDQDLGFASDDLPF
jgi:single-strand DNA-binding protein